MGFIWSRIVGGGIKDIWHLSGSERTKDELKDEATASLQIERC